MGDDSTPSSGVIVVTVRIIRLNRGICCVFPGHELPYFAEGKPEELKVLDDATWDELVQPLAASEAKKQREIKFFLGISFFFLYSFLGFQMWYDRHDNCLQMLIFGVVGSFVMLGIIHREIKRIEAIVDEVQDSFTHKGYRISTRELKRTFLIRNVVIDFERTSKVV